MCSLAQNKRRVASTLYFYGLWALYRLLAIKHDAAFNKQGETVYNKIKYLKIYKTRMIS